MSRVVNVATWYDSTPSTEEIDEGLRHATAAIRALQLHGTHEQVAAAKRYRDRLIEQRAR